MDVVRHPFTLAILLALILAAFQLPLARLVDDDRIQTGILEGSIACCGHPPFGLYAFLGGEEGEVRALRDRGPLPWFVHPALRIHFFRPISSALIAVDHALFGTWAPGYRIQTTFWYLALVAILGATIRIAGAAVDPDPARYGALFAPLVFALSPLHWQPLAYTAARWTLIAAVLGLGGVACHAAWRRHGWRAGRPLSIVAFVLSLLAGEAGVAMLAYLLAYEMAARSDAIALRARAVAPAAAIAVAYLLLYAWLGYGSSGGEGYLNPMEEPARFLQEAPGRLVAMSGEILAASPARYASIEGMRSRAWIAGIAGIGLLAVPYLRSRRALSPTLARVATWWALGAAGSLIPLAGSPPDSRHLVIPWIGVSVLVGIVTACALAPRGVAGRRSWIDLPLPAILILLHVVLAPWRWYATSVEFAAYRDAFETAARAEALVAPVASARTVFLTPLTHLTLQGYFLRKMEGLPLPEAWWPLTAAPVDHLYRRTGPASLVLEIPQGSLLASPQERGVRHRHPPLRPGDVVALDGLTVRVIDAGAEGPTRVEFAFDRVLEDPSYRFVAATKGGIRVLRPPREGETLLLPR